jgi:hypothetical protein
VNSAAKRQGEAQGKAKMINNQWSINDTNI